MYFILSFMISFRFLFISFVSFFIFATINYGDENTANFSSEVLNVASSSNISDIEGDLTEIGEELPFWKTNSLLKVLFEGGWIMLPLVLLFFLSMILILERTVFYTKNSIWNTKEAAQDFLASCEGVSDIENYEVLYDTLQEHSKIYIAKLDKGLFLMGGVANVAPLMGFLGTVLGMIEAFSSIATATNVNAKVVALGIQQALVTTAAGLIVAVPAFIAYYVFSNLVQSVASYLEKDILEISQKKPRLLNSSIKE